MQGISNEDSSQQSQSSESEPLTSTESSNSSEADESLLLQMRMGGGRRSSSLPHTSSASNTVLRDKLLEFSLESKVEVNPGFNVLDYWYARRFDSPEIYRLAQVALSVPPTEVEVERMFSALALVLTHLRNRLSAETLDEIMIIKMNSEKVLKIDFSNY